MRIPSWPGLRRSVYSRFDNAAPDRLDRSAVVFAPHQDDETLGCGGTIALKRRLGIPVTLVFMTDGSTSHRRFLAADDLHKLRTKEALAAAELLGIEEGGVQFLDFPDGQLARHHQPAVERVRLILERERPDEVFVPYHADRTPDHEATYFIVSEAIRLAGHSLRLLEYPVWLWNQWPSVPLSIGFNRDGARSLARAFKAGSIVAEFKSFQDAVWVREVLPIKREALACHASQMTELINGVGWPTLGEVSNGAFLNSFFSDLELFRCQVSDRSGRLSPNAGGPRLMKPSDKA